MLEWDILNYLKKWRTNLRATTEENYRIFRTEYDNCERLWNKYYPNASVL